MRDGGEGKGWLKDEWTRRNRKHVDGLMEKLEK